MPGESINKGVKLATKKYILVLSGHTQIIQMDFEHVKKELENHLAVLVNKYQ